MTKVIRYSFLSLVFGILILSASVADASGQNVLGEILRRMDINNKSIQSLRVGVTMTKHNPQLNTSDVSVGSASYLPKAAKRYVRIDWTKPMVEHISIIGDTYESYRPHIKQVITGKVNNAKNNASAGNALAFMNMSQAQLKANYDVVYLGEEVLSAGVRTWHLQLNPKAAASYKNAELWVDSDGMPRQAKIIERNNDTTTVLLSNIEKNITLQAKIFKLSYPSDVKKIKA
jgi:outer membrane lipoprotein-sorting protein